MRSAVAYFGARNLVRQPGQPEVCEQDLSAAIQHDVAGLQISMQYSFLVCRCQAGAEFARNFERFIRRQAADAAKQRTKILAVDIFHGEKNMPVNFADVVDAAHIGMRHLPRHAHLVSKTGECIRVAERAFGQEFQGHRLI